MTEREALKLALEALENWKHAYPDEFDEFDEDALKAIKETLAQPEQEPLAWFRYESFYEYRNQLARCTKDCIGAFPVYTAPPQGIYYTPPQRKPLTDEEITQVFGVGYVAKEFVEFVRAIEAAHGITDMEQP